MALDPRRPLTHNVEGVRPPRILQRPADAPPPLGHLRDDGQVLRLRNEWANRVSPHASVRTTIRGWAGRITGRSDRRLLVALVDATNAVANHCDQLTDRLNAQEALSEDVAGTFGEDITNLRAEVIHLRRLVADLHVVPDG